MARARKRAFIWLSVAVLALLGMGALKLRQDFLTRGIPDGLPEPVAHSGAQIGLNVYLEPYDDDTLDDNLNRIVETGIQTVKQSFYFREPFDWAAADKLVTAVSTHNLTLVPLLDGNPDNDFATPETAAFAAWAGEFAARYGDRIQYYIIWDEPNLTAHWGNQPVNATAYGALLTATAGAIRAADSDAVIVAAPLAPTTETGPLNLADWRYLQALYDTGTADAFDVVAGKPYGFFSGPDDRTVAEDRLNFSRIILLRQVMVDNGDAHKAIWAGNWGWNSLASDWRGRPSAWGQTSASGQTANTLAALERAQREWTWIGIMFLENWQAGSAPDDPRWGFSIAGTETAVAIRAYLSAQDRNVAYPGFHLAQPDAPGQRYEGGWEFSPQFGADISEHPEDVLLGDRVTFTFWGTDLGLRVRRADFRARLYITVDGEPANALPSDENGTTLILTSPVQTADYISTEWVARNLPPGVHTAEIAASRGWDQWALNGFSVAYHPPGRGYRWGLWGMGSVFVFAVLLAIRSFRQTDWGNWFCSLATRYRRLSQAQQLGLTAMTAVLVVVAGWLTWGEQMGGVYRRFGDGTQLILTAVVAAIYYVTPTFLVYMVALALLLVLLTFRPTWGLALVAICFPFYVPPTLKPILNYRFSPVEVFTLLTFTAFILSRLTQYLSRYKQTITPAPPHPLTSDRRSPSPLHPADYAVLAFTLVATLSLFFTERLDVASNEWRVVILEPVLFYVVFRGVQLKEKEMWVILDAFVLGGLIVALFGLWQYGFARESLITAEGGLLRIKSVYGSPNNVALYLGRLLPLLAAMAWLGGPEHGWRRRVYTAVLVPVGLVMLLTFSKGALFLGLPAAFLFIFWQWQEVNGRRAGPWFILFGLLGIGGLFAIQQIPSLAGRLNLVGETGVFRLNLWRASLNMIADHPFFGVGLDNFLYEHRGRYIFEAAWRDPNLSHPHNLLLDFGTRLGLLGLAAGTGMIWQFWQTWRRCRERIPPPWFPVLVGIGGAAVAMVAHGMVDHGFFLVDLAFTFFLLLGTAVWMQDSRNLAG